MILTFVLLGARSKSELCRNILCIPFWCILPAQRSPYFLSQLLVLHSQKSPEYLSQSGSGSPGRQAHLQVLHEVQSPFPEHVKFDNGLK